MTPFAQLGEMRKEAGAPLGGMRRFGNVRKVEDFARGFGGQTKSGLQDLLDLLRGRRVKDIPFVNRRLDHPPVNLNQGAFRAGADAAKATPGAALGTAGVVGLMDLLKGDDAST